MRKTTTTNFADFGWRERKMAAELLTTSCEQGFPEDFEDSEVTIMMNFNSGNVFFTNSEFQVAMMNGDTLESFYSLPYSGEEGFKDDFIGRDKSEFNQDDINFLVQIGVFSEDEICEDEFMKENEEEEEEETEEE
jgi:hypothetical protein